MSDECDQVLGYLASSPVRVSLLAHLVDEPARPAGLVESTDASRTTVHRTLADFLEREWVRQNDSAYVATGLGEVTLDSYRQARDRFHELDRLGPVLAGLDAADGLDPAWLESAQLETTTESNPQRPIEWYLDRIEGLSGECLRGVTPVINRQFINAHAPVVDAGTPTELVIAKPTFELVREQYPETLADSLEIDSYDLYVTSTVPSIGLILLADRVFLGTYGDDGQLRAVLAGDDDRFASWAIERFRQFREEARPVSSRDLPE